MNAVAYSTRSSTASPPLAKARGHSRKPTAHGSRRNPLMRSQYRTHTERITVRQPEVAILIHGRKQSRGWSCVACRPRFAPRGACEPTLHGGATDFHMTAIHIELDAARMPGRAHVLVRRGLLHHLLHLTCEEVPVWARTHEDGTNSLRAKPPSSSSSEPTG